MKDWELKTVKLNIKQQQKNHECLMCDNKFANIWLNCIPGTISNSFVKTKERSQIEKDNWVLKKQNQGITTDVIFSKV